VKDKRGAATRMLGIVGLALALRLTAAAETPQSAHPASPLTVEITSPLGRTGISGPVRIVARIGTSQRAALSPVQFFVDGKLVGERKDGPPYAVEWTDDNPYEAREIAVEVSDSLGNTARDVVRLKPLEVAESASVSSVVLEPAVLDATGRPVNGLTATDFHVLEDGVPQTIDMAIPDAIPATYTLLVDSSQSMSRRLDFVREAARELPSHLRPADQVIIAPFSRTLGAITGPTKDRETIGGAIDAIQAKGGTAILDSLAALADQLSAVPSRHIIVLITDGYDEDSTVKFETSLAAIKATHATVYVVAIGGVAGISLDGEDLLKRIATETGGRAFFPYREFQLTDVHGLIASDVQDRYVITYTPSNQTLDGTFRQITLTTNNPTHKIRVRSGYRAPAPPPIRPQLELTFRDLNRQFVDIGAADLVIVEDGVEQKIEGFEEALTPVSIVLVLDASGSMKKGAAQVVAAARSFVQALPEQDSLGVMQFADKAVLLQDLSTQRAASLDAIDQYQAAGGTALYDALVDTLARLKRADGRRVVVLLTDGRDENNPGTAPGSVHSVGDVLTSLKDAGATLFSIGLGTQVDRPLLEQLALVSGGESFFPDDVSSLDANYHRILENLRRRYIISYTSTNSTRNGAWRSVDIKSTHSGIVVESKGGYFAPAKGGDQ
jgi:Ca-activated chloride channel family protein